MDLLHWYDEVWFVKSVLWACVRLHGLYFIILESKLGSSTTIVYRYFQIKISYFLTYVYTVIYSAIALILSFVTCVVMYQLFHYLIKSKYNIKITIMDNGQYRF